MSVTSAMNSTAAATAAAAAMMLPNTGTFPGMHIHPPNAHNRNVLGVHHAAVKMDPSAAASAAAAFAAATATATGELMGPTPPLAVMRIVSNGGEGRMATASATLVEMDGANGMAVTGKEGKRRLSVSDDNWMKRYVSEHMTHRLVGHVLTTYSCIHCHNKCDNVVAVNMANE